MILKYRKRIYLTTKMKYTDVLFELQFQIEIQSIIGLVSSAARGKM